MPLRVPVLGHRPGHYSIVETARDDDRQLQLATATSFSRTHGCCAELFECAARFLQIVPRAPDPCRRNPDGCASESPAAAHRCAASMSALLIDRLVRRDREPDRCEETLLGDAILRDRHTVGRRAHDAMLGKEAQRLRRNIFEFGGGGGAAMRERIQRSGVDIVGGDVCVGDAAGRAVGCRGRARALCSPCSERPW